MEKICSFTGPCANNEELVVVLSISRYLGPQAIQHHTLDSSDESISWTKCSLTQVHRSPALLCHRHDPRHEVLQDAQFITSKPAVSLWRKRLEPSHPCQRKGQEMRHLSSESQRPTILAKGQLLVRSVQLPDKRRRYLVFSDSDSTVHLPLKPQTRTNSQHSKNLSEPLLTSCIRLWSSALSISLTSLKNFHALSLNQNVFSDE